MSNHHQSTRSARRGAGATIAELAIFDMRCVWSEEERARRKRKVLMGQIAGSARDDARERSAYLNRKIRQVAGLE